MMCDSAAEKPSPALTGSGCLGKSRGLVAEKVEGGVAGMRPAPEGAWVPTRIAS